MNKNFKNQSLLGDVVRSVGKRFHGRQVTVMQDEITTIGGHVAGPRFEGDHDHLYDANGVPAHG